MKINRLKRTLTLSFFLTVSTVLFAQQRYEFSVKECVEYASKNNLQVKNALLGIRIQEQTNKEYTALAYPRLGASVGVNYFPQVATQVFPNFIAMATYGVLNQEGVKNGSGNTIQMPADVGYVNAKFGTTYNASAGFDFSQILFDGQVFIGLQARAAALDLSRKSAALTEENIKVNIHKIYYQLIASKIQLGSLDANIDRLEKLKREAQILYQNGFAEKLDLDKLEVTLSNLKTEKEKIVRQIETGYLGLKFLMGMPLADLLVLTENLTEEDLKTVGIEDQFKYADRKEIQQIEVAAQLGEFNVRRYELSQVPTLAMFGQYSTNAQRNDFSFLDGNKKWFPSSLIGVKMSVPIFQGFATKAHIQKAKYELEQTLNNKQLLEQSIDFEVAQAKVKYRNAIVAMDAQKKNRQLAENVYQLTTKKYGQGLGSNLEVTNAQSELRVAENNYYNALYDAIIAKVDLLKATGKL